MRAVGLELNIHEKRVDNAFELLLKDGETKYLLLEFLFGERTFELHKYFIKTAMATDHYGKGKVATVVVQLTEGSGKPIKPVYEVELEGIRNLFEIRVVYLNEYIEKIESGELYEFAPLLPLLKGGADERLLREVKDLIKTEPDQKKLSELYSTALTVAGRYITKEFLWEFFKEELEMIQESPIVQEWINEGYRKGEDEGYRKGEDEGYLKAGREMLLDILEERFGLLKRSIIDEIRGIDSHEFLKALNRHALRVDNLDRFIEIVQQAND